MKSGEYYIGDLAYVMHDVWDEVCELLYPEDSVGRGLEGEFTLKDGRKFALYSTNYGDGVYNTDFGYSCSVDSGSIGCILKSDIRDKSYTTAQIRGLAVFQTFKKDFNTGFEFDEYTDDAGYRVEEKIIQFGGFQVYT